MQVFAGCITVCATERLIAPHTIFSQNTSGRIVVGVVCVGDEEEDFAFFFDDPREGRDGEDDDDVFWNVDWVRLEEKVDSTTRCCFFDVMDTAFADCAVFRASADLKPAEMADDRSIA